MFFIADGVEVYQETNNQSIKLEAKPNRGVWLDGDRASITQLFSEMTWKRPAIFLNHDERVRYIMLKMLVADNYITISNLAEITGVSRNTIAGDLQDVERFVLDPAQGICGAFDLMIHKGQIAGIHPSDRMEQPEFG